MVIMNWPEVSVLNDMEKGNRVRFLNQTGGGIVIAVKGSMCVVQDEDGWEWTVRESELVKVPMEKEIEEKSIERTIGKVRQQDGKPVKRSGPPEGCTEIDLHAENLCRGITSPVAIHIRQKDTVCSVLEREKFRHGKRIIFIHGKGDGTLRNEIIAELKRKTAYFTWEDAPFAQYGYHGAIKVTVK